MHAYAAVSHPHARRHSLRHAPKLRAQARPVCHARPLLKRGSDGVASGAGGAMRARLALLCCALACAACRAGSERASKNASVAERWAGWLADEVVAHRYARTREELEHFGKACEYLAPTWAGLADLHASLERVLVLDCRHNWNGLGDSHERWNFLLRVGRSLRRATFLWADGCADPDGPPRLPAQGVPAPVRPAGCQFDPGAFVAGLGGVGWRWDAAARRRVERAAGATQREAELALHYHCLREGHRGCLHARLRFAANGSTALEVEGPAGDDTAAAVLSYLDALPQRWLRLETSVQGDLTREAFSEFACTHGAGAPRPECGQSCESFANWRPRPRTWAALRPTLLRLDAWAATAALTVRTGAADHIGRLPEILSAAEAEAEEAGLSRPGALAAALEPLFADCAPDVPKAARDRRPGEAPCTHWRSDNEDAVTPHLGEARACAGSDAPLPRDDATEALFNFSAGPMGAAMACAARAAASLAAAAGAPDRWGLMLFSDAPALKCVLEASAAAAAGHVAWTASAPGHIQYAPAGPMLRAAGLAAVVDWFLLGLMDTQLAVFGSAFAGAARVRAFRPQKHPPGAPNPYLARGFERWFELGRENHGLQGQDQQTLRLLAATHAACPAERDAVRDAAAMYAGKIDARPDEGGHEA